MRTRAWKPWLALAATGACAVLLWNSQQVPRPSGPAPDAGTTAVGDSLPTEPQAPAPTQKQPLAQEPLPEPRPGQARPDKRGQCPGRKQVPINGACWIDVSSVIGAQDCAESGSVPFKGKCFVPADPPPKKPKPTSSPPEAR